MAHQGHTALVSECGLESTGERIEAAREERDLVGGEVGDEALEIELLRRSLLQLGERELVVVVRQEREDIDERGADWIGRPEVRLPNRDEELKGAVPLLAGVEGSSARRRLVGAEHVGGDLEQVDEHIRQARRHALADVVDLEIDIGLLLRMQVESHRLVGGFRTAGASASAQDEARLAQAVLPPRRSSARSFLNATCPKRRAFSGVIPPSKSVFENQLPENSSTMRAACLQ